MMVTGSHPVNVNGAILYVCNVCGGFYRTEQQASNANRSRDHGGEGNGKSHSCLARPKP